MTTGPNADDGRAELFVADFHPRLGEYLAQRQARGYDAVAARARFLFWLAAHADRAAMRPPGVRPGGLPGAGLTPGDVLARDALAGHLAQAPEAAAPGAGEIAELGALIGAGRQAEEALTASGTLTADQRASLERTAGQGRRARDRLLDAYLRLVARIAERYAGRGVPFLDLVQEGSHGLIRAAEQFDAGQGHAFSGYATWWIRQAITRAVAANARTARIPARLGAVIGEIAEVQRRLLRELGREPTPEELAAELGGSPG
jgi:hypothetical protein